MIHNHKGSLSVMSANQVVAKVKVLDRQAGLLTSTQVSAYIQYTSAAACMIAGVCSTTHMTIHDSHSGREYASATGPLSASIVAVSKTYAPSCCIAST